MRVGDGVRDRHRAGQGDLQLLLGVGAGVARLSLMDTALERQRAAHHRHHRFVAVGADAHLDFVGEIDAVDEFEEAVHEVLARLLAVADDVDAGIFLMLQPKQRGIQLGGGELVAGQLPLRPQLVGFGEPGRFRQTAGNGRGKQHGAFTPRGVHVESCT